MKTKTKVKAGAVDDIASPQILIADGASFKGNIDMDV
jgi:hypothetical protein